MGITHFKKGSEEEDRSCKLINIACVPMPILPKDITSVNRPTTRLSKAVLYAKFTSISDCTQWHFAVCKPTWFSGLLWPTILCAAEDVSHDWAAERAQADDNAFKCKYYRFLATRVCINNMLIYYCCTKLSGGWKFKAKCCDEVKYNKLFLREAAEPAKSRKEKKSDVIWKATTYVNNAGFQGFF